MSGLAELDGKVAVVTGGASGIGRGIAARLAAEGMHVVIADVEKQALQATAAELGVVGVETDVSNLESVQALARAVLDRYGAVHVVCNNAGIGGTARIADLGLSDWRWTLEVNLWGVIHGVHVFLPHLLGNRDGGHIVNTSSMAGLRATPGLGAYAVSKFGIVALSEALAAELEEDGARVGVSVLCPAIVRTRIGEFLRNRPEEYADGQFGKPEVTARSDGGLRAAARSSRAMEPEEAGALVVAAIKRGDLYVLTDPSRYPVVEQRHRRIAAAFEEAAARAGTGEA